MNEEADKTQQYLETIAEEIEMIAQRVDLDLGEEIEIEALQSDAFYYHIIAQIFQEELVIKEADLDKFAEMDVGARIQYLIDYLSQTVLKVELEHINGFKSKRRYTQCNCYGCKWVYDSVLCEHEY